MYSLLDSIIFFLKKTFCDHVLILTLFSHSVLVKFEVDHLVKSLRKGNKEEEIQKDLKGLTFSIFQETFSISLDIILFCENHQKLWDFF